MKTGDQIVQDLPWRWSVQGKIFIIGGLGYMFDAWDVALNGFLTPLLGEEFDLSTGARGLVATSNLVGMAVGAILWGTIADRMGRKKAFSLTLLIFALFSVLGAFSPNYEIFLLLRFLAGIGLGGCIPVDYALVSEFSPRKVRGKVLAAMDGWWPVGATLCGAAATLALPLDHNWRWMLGMMVAPALLLFWVRRGIPESPLYLVSKGQEAEAREVIDGLVASTGAQPEPYVIEPVAAAEKTSRGLRAGLDQLRSIWAFSPRITSVAWLMSITIMLVYYAALSWMPSILRAQGYGEQQAFVGTTVMSTVGILGVFASILLIDVVGRKWVIGVTAPLAAVALVVFSIVLEADGYAVLWIGVFGFLILMAIPVLYAYVSELYPTELRASGFGWASSSSRVAAGLTPVLFGSVLWPVLGLTWTFAVMAGVLLLSVFWMVVAAPETKGMDLDQVPEDPAVKDTADPLASAAARISN